MKITIGRDKHCDIRIENQNVSNRHAHIQISGNSYILTDHSKNGTLVDNTILHNKSMQVTPDSLIVLASIIPLDWKRINNSIVLKESKKASNNGKPYNANPYMEQENTENDWNADMDEDENITFDLAVLCFLFFPVGIVLYFHWRQYQKIKASQALIISMIAIFINLLILGLLLFNLFSMETDPYLDNKFYY